MNSKPKFKDNRHYAVKKWLMNISTEDHIQDNNVLGLSNVGFDHNVSMATPNLNPDDSEDDKSSALNNISTTARVYNRNRELSVNGNNCLSKVNAPSAAKHRKVKFQIPDTVHHATKDAGYSGDNNNIDVKEQNTKRTGLVGNTVAFLRDAANRKGASGGDGKSISRADAYVITNEDVSHGLVTQQPQEGSVDHIIF